MLWCSGFNMYNVLWFLWARPQFICVTIFSNTSVEASDNTKYSCLPCKVWLVICPKIHFNPWELTHGNAAAQHFELKPCINSTDFNNIKISPAVFLTLKPVMLGCENSSLIALLTPGTDNNMTRLVAYCFSSCVPVPLPLLCTLKYWTFRSYSLTKVGQEVGTSLLSSTAHTDGRKSVNISLLSCYSQSYLLHSVPLTLFFAKKCLKFIM